MNEWYNFTTVQRYKALTAEEAEEQFQKRDKILNYFSVMGTKKKQEGETGESFADEKPKKGKGKAGLKVSDMDEWASDSDGAPDGEESDEEAKPKNKKNVKRGKKKKKGSDDESAFEESDEGDFDQREVDYMSATSSSEEEEPEDDRINREMKGVEDEDALRQLVVTDSEEEEENAEEDDKDRKDGKELEQAKSQLEEVKIKQEKEGVYTGKTLTTANCPTNCHRVLRLVCWRVGRFGLRRLQVPKRHIYAKESG